MHGFITSNGQYCSSTLPESTVVPATHIASGQELCFDATNILQVGGAGSEFIVLNGGSVILVAGAKIIMLPGAKVDQGGYMHGFITTTGIYCDPKEAEIVEFPANVVGRGEDAKKAKIYPNPTAGKFTLAFREEFNGEPVVAEIFGMRGERILKRRLEGLRNYEFSLEGRQPGLYFLRIVSGLETRVFKVIKQ